jgi:hypothetical protein
MVVIPVCQSSLVWLLVCCVGEGELWLNASVRVIVILAWLVFLLKMVVVPVCRSSLVWLLVCCVEEGGGWLIAIVQVIDIWAW